MLKRLSSAILSLGPKTVVITLGESGCLVKTDVLEFISPAYKIQVVDTTGAGDVFHGAFVFGLLKKWNLKKPPLLQTQRRL
ncbi:MAG: PfkB family carbohydrate kinase [Spirochaetota bacterium]